jgi:hypothetical protein
MQRNAQLRRAVRRLIHISNQQALLLEAMERLFGAPSSRSRERVMEAESYIRGLLQMPHKE